MTDVPSQNIEAEESVLGAMLVAEPALTRVIDKVKLNAGDFYFGRHQAIFAAIRDLFAASKPVDELSVADALKRSGKTEKAGGKHYVSELAAKVPAAGNAEHYAEIVKREAMERAKRKVGQELLNGLAPAEAIERLRKLDAPVAATSSLVSFSEIVARPVRFAWRDRIALGKITALAGRPKIGKGLLYSHLISEVTRGTLDGELGGPRRAIILTTEDEPGDTLKPRLMAAGADLSLVSYFTMGSLDEPVPFRVPKDADELSRRVAETEAALIVLDPLVEFLDGKLDANKSQGVRRALASINAIAREHGCAVLSVVHLNKGLSNDALLRTEGSAAFSQVVRGGLMLGYDPSDPDEETGSRRVLAVSSTNLSQVPPSLAYEISGAVVEGDTGEEIKTARIHLVGASAAGSQDLLGSGREDDDAKADHDEAIEFLRVELEDGPKAANDVKKAATAAEIGPGALKRARRKLGVKKRKDGMRGPWVLGLSEREIEEYLRQGDAHALAVPLGDEPSSLSPSSSSGSRAKSDRPLREEFSEDDGPTDARVADLGIADEATSPCRYPDHRASDWIGAGGQRRCGVCHPRVKTTDEEGSG